MVIFGCIYGVFGCFGCFVRIAFSHGLVSNSVVYVVLLACTMIWSVVGLWRFVA